MAPNPSCSALAAAKDKKGELIIIPHPDRDLAEQPLSRGPPSRRMKFFPPGLSYSQIASQIGVSEQRVIDICTGSSAATTAEFDSLAKVLDIKSQVPQDAAHTRA
ncbi:uncharacterized protein FIBRA_04801 [Fibroporia radiculosa]|uniref:HTH cro/C1-type domain-containing protein n=1 Tax=Fibroporia radiculosa TaxID=599839 RepID=J4GPU4_9APHY|nr:uncharacterized protein FIBRA_04801 [Fibroporia radiculosa]CCM02695.1 predicted protein [Fibroporia radiculosa]